MCTSISATEIRGFNKFGHIPEEWGSLAGTPIFKERNGYDANNIEALAC